MLLLIVVVAFFPAILPAQIWGIGMKGTSSFSRQLDAFNWNYANAYAIKSGDWFTSHRSSFESQLFLLNGQAENIQDEWRHTSLFQYQFDSNWSTTSTLQFYQYSGNNIERIDAAQNFQYQNAEGFSMRPSIGFLSDKRDNNHDQGLHLRFDGDYADDFDIESFSSSANVYGSWADLSPRSRNRYGADIGTDFNENEFRFKTDMFYHAMTQSSYQPSSFLNRNITNVIEDYITDSLYAGAQAVFPAGEKWNINAQSYFLQANRTFENRNLSGDSTLTLYDSRYINTSLQSTIKAEYNGAQNTFSTGLNYIIGSNQARLINTGSLSEEQLNRRQEQLRNIFYDFSELRFFTEGQWRPSSFYQLDYGASTHILRYDTPESNFDDRDELTLDTDMTHRFRFSPEFRFSLLLSAEAFHKVFLSSQRSFENSWRRSLRFQPTAFWQPVDWIRIHQQFLVRANYTTFDYQPDDGSSNDQSSREWGLTSDVQVDLDSNVRANMSFSRYFLLIGQLFWDDFAETPLDTLITTRYEGELEFHKSQQTFAVGVKAYTKEDFIPATTLQLADANGATLPILSSGQQTTLQLGPSVRIAWPLGKGNRIDLSGWLQWQYIKRSFYTEVVESFESSLTREEEWRFVREFPNINMSVTYHF
jgi:hypothetical protein